MMVSGDDYKDMLSMPHHISTKRPQMSMEGRAAQFAAYAALTGHGAAVKEAAKKNDEKYEK